MVAWNGVDPFSPSSSRLRSTGELHRPYCCFLLGGRARCRTLVFCFGISCSTVEIHSLEAKKILRSILLGGLENLSNDFNELPSLVSIIWFDIRTAKRFAADGISTGKSPSAESVTNVFHVGILLNPI